MNKRSLMVLFSLFLVGTPVISGQAGVYLEAGVDVDARDAKGMTPVMYAARESKFAFMIIDLLAAALGIDDLV